MRKMGYVLLALSGLLGMRTLYHYYHVLLFPYDITNGEGFVLRDAYYLWAGKNIYLPIESAPYIVANYPPLFPYLSAWLINITGVNFFAVRLVSCIAVLLSVLGIYRICFIKTNKQMPALVAALFFSHSLYVYYWGAWARVDALAVLWSIGAIAVLCSSTRYRWLCVAVVLCVLAVYTKQSAFAAWASSTLYLFLHDKRKGVFFASAFVLLTGTIFIWLNHQTHGEFYRHVVTYNQLKWYPRVFLGQVKNFVFTHIFYISAFIIYLLKHRNIKDLLCIYALITLLTTLTTGREGASTNYFIESIAVLCVYVGMVVHSINLDTVIKKAAFTTIVVLQYTMIIAPYMKIFNEFTRTTPEFGLHPNQAIKQRCASLEAYIQQTTGDILIENPGFAVINGKEVIGNAAVLKYLARIGIHEPSAALIHNIRAQKFELIIFQGEAYAYDILHATDAYYEIIDRIDCIGEYEIKAPKQQ